MSSCASVVIRHCDWQKDLDAEALSCLREAVDERVVGLLVGTQHDTTGLRSSCRLAVQELGHEGMDDQAAKDRVSAIDAKTTARMKEIIAKHGGPGRSLVDGGRDRVGARPGRPCPGTRCGT
jgi:hypothetical protein